MAEILTITGSACAVGHCVDWDAALEAYQAYQAAGTSVDVFLAAPGTRESPRAIERIHRLAPLAAVITLGQGDGRVALDTGVKERIDRAVRAGRAEREDLARKLNAAEIERLLIEREAEKMSRRITALQSDLKNNLFIRSVLHTLINILQVQLSLDKEEKAVVEEMKSLTASLSAVGGPAAGDVCRRLQQDLFPRLEELRGRTEGNIHKAMMGYVKAIQRSLMGKSGFYSERTASLSQAVERVRAKYEDMLKGKRTGVVVEFRNELPDAEQCVYVFDFVLVAALENLMTNSLRKLLESGPDQRWIRVSTAVEMVMNERYLVLVWEDNGPGVAEDRKESIFSGDSDKIEDGDHGVGLSTMKLSIESAGGFVREEGVPGQGARFLLGFPQPAEPEKGPSFNMDPAG